MPTHSSLSGWAANPHGAPPIPFDTPTVGRSSEAYAVGAIPPAALAQDLAAAGVGFAPGRGGGYRLHGRPVDRYALGDVIAEQFSTAADLLRYFLGTDDRALAVTAAEAAAAAAPFRDDAAAHAESARLRARREVAAATFEAATGLPFDALPLVAASLDATARSILRIQAVRFEAVRRFAQALAPTRAPASTEAELIAFLCALPETRIKRSSLPTLAAEAGLTVGDRTLYALAGRPGAPGLLGAPTRHRGEWHYSARVTPQEKEAT